jgi:NADH:ubiquinone oxidoreductase subunit D
MLRGSVLLGIYENSTLWYIIYLINIPVGTRGDCYDRFNSYTEMRESIKIITMS